jgi:DNA-binding MarR family transcriptional regulator
MIQTSNGAVAQKLLEAFMRIRRIGWRQSSIAGLTISEIMVLHVIRKAVASDGEGIRVSEISAHLNVASPTITQQINSLVTQGYVQRKIDSGDRRAVRITITDKGKKLLKEHSEAFLASINGLVEYLGEQDSLVLADLLGKVFTYFHESGQSSTNQAY